MRILSISAQKPDSTGSGVYMTELIKTFDGEGHTQAVIAGIGPEDEVFLPDKVRFDPVCFETEDLPFPVVGMSDEMPYKSTRYCDLTPEMTRQFEQAFSKVLDRVVREFRPDVILCHHLYLLTALTRDRFPEQKIYGFCHNTDLRQMQKTDLKREFIAEKIRALDGIFVLQEAQIDRILKIYHADKANIHVVGIGYNAGVFHQTSFARTEDAVRIVFAGKIAEKKGVMSLLRAMNLLTSAPDEVRLFLAGGAGNQEEYGEIQALAEKCRYPVVFVGKLSQQKLAELYNACDIFVLPSFYEGLPLTAVEALACGDQVVMSDLPGIADWMETFAPGARIRYVTLPHMHEVDEPEQESLPAFERKLSKALDISIREVQSRGRMRTLAADVSRICWEQVAGRIERVLKFYDK